MKLKIDMIDIFGTNSYKELLFLKIVQFKCCSDWPAFLNITDNGNIMFQFCNENFLNAVVCLSENNFQYEDFLWKSGFVEKCSM